MGDGRPVSLSIPPVQAEYLLRELNGFKSRLQDDVEAHPDRPGAQRWLADAEAYGRLIAGLDAGAVVPDDHLRRLVSEWIEAHERSEHYERVVFEHDAIVRLGEQIGAGR
jgi:hypothetical protein